MATISTYMVPPYLTPNRVAAISTIVFDLVPPTSGIASGDLLDVAIFPAGSRLLDAWVQTEASIGAGATLTLTIGGTAVTGATTAASQSLVRMTRQTAPSTTELPIRLTVGGAGITAAGRITAVVFYQNP